MKNVFQYTEKKRAVPFGTALSLRQENDYEL
jgi:hypothetical protein